jgi:hypothetical protein
MKRRALLALLAASPAMASAQAARPRIAVPYYRAADFVGGAQQGWFAPRAREFEAESGQLRDQLQSACSAAPQRDSALSEIRSRWRRTALAFDRLAGVSVGPLLSRRSARQIDFWPTRPEAVTRAIQAAPRDLRALERMGTPAKGLGALEWLLWSRPGALGDDACGYAALLAEELHQEARALSQAFGELAKRDWNERPEQAETAMAELVNQWVGALEALRWQRMERPRRSGGGTPRYPRQAGGIAAESWAARWEALAALGVLPAERAAPAPGAGLVPLETYLRGRGLNPLADRLEEAMSRAGGALRGTRPADAGRVRSAAAAIGRAKQVAEAEVAPALDVQLGFSDSDGD